LKNWILKTLALATVAVWAAALVVPDERLHVVFCDVGQGDAILVYRRSVQMLVDGGPDEKALACLARHMPFYDQRIEVVVATHPQADHIGGLTGVVGRYSIGNFVSGPEANSTAGFEGLQRQITSRKLRVSNLYAGDEIRMGGIVFKIVWPEKRWAMAHLQNFGEGNRRRGVILGVKTDGTDLNSFGISGIVSYGTFDLMLTADVDQMVEPEEMETGLLRPVEVLKVPHHGSKTGMTPEWLEKVSPRLSVISAGKKNRYGHPNEEAINLLRDQEIKILRTDVDGEVEIISDGKTYSYR